MIKNKKTTDQEQYHPDPRNEIEKFLAYRIPMVIEAYGLGNIKFNFITPTDIEGAPEDGVFCIKYDPVYKSAFITIAPQALALYKAKEYKTLTDSLVHEIGHIITWKLSVLAKDRQIGRAHV